MNSRKHIIDGGNFFSSFYLSFIFQKICWRKGDKNQDSILHIQALLAKNGTSLISCHKRSYKETQNFVVCPLFCECLVIVRFFCRILMMSFCTNLLGLNCRGQQKVFLSTQKRRRIIKSSIIKIIQVGFNIIILNQCLMIEGLESMHNLLSLSWRPFLLLWWSMSSPLFYPHKLSGDEIGWLIKVGFKEYYGKLRALAS